MNQYLTNSKNTTGGRWTVARRTGHGGLAWTQSATLLQPQDGAYTAGEAKAKVTGIDSRLQRAAFLESEDASLTGGTRSLVRRLLGLNVVRPMTTALTATTQTAKPAGRVVKATQQPQVA